jgi:hypothetical protein
MSYEMKNALFIKLNKGLSASHLLPAEAAQAEGLAVLSSSFY